MECNFDEGGSEDIRRRTCVYVLVGTDTLATQISVVQLTCYMYGIRGTKPGHLDVSIRKSPNSLWQIYGDMTFERKPRMASLAFLPVEVSFPESFYLKLTNKDYVITPKDDYSWSEGPRSFVERPQESKTHLP
jgi:hypothetical protein